MTTIIRKRPCMAVAGAVAALLLSASASAEGFKAGIDFEATASLQEIGLPLYPGAQPRKDPEEAKGNKSAVSMGIWGGSFGLKLQAARFTSTDQPEAVARFYREALARYGKLLDCSAGVAREAQPGDKAKDGDQLRCDDDKPKAGALVYKAGSKKDFRVVSVEPQGAGKPLEFQLVHFQGKGF